jgi:hypothetical protein
MQRVTNLNENVSLKKIHYEYSNTQHKLSTLEEVQVVSAQADRQRMQPVRTSMVNLKHPISV